MFKQTVLRQKSVPEAEITELPVADHLADVRKAQLAGARHGLHLAWDPVVHHPPRGELDLQGLTQRGRHHHVFPELVPELGDRAHAPLIQVHRVGRLRQGHAAVGRKAVRPKTELAPERHGLDLLPEWLVVLERPVGRIVHAENDCDHLVDVRGLPDHLQPFLVLGPPEQRAHFDLGEVNHHEFAPLGRADHVPEVHAEGLLAREILQVQVATTAAESCGRVGPTIHQSPIVSPIRHRARVKGFQLPGKGIDASVALHGARPRAGLLVLGEPLVGFLAVLCQ